MSREIKFRAWDEEAEYMYYSDRCWENAEATFVCESDGTLKCYVPEVIDATRDEPEHTVGREIFPIMQFTGLKDKSGKEIYHHDILQIQSPDLTTEHLLGEVIWDFMSWQIKDGGMLDSFKNLHLEVIGNIYEHKDLLEQGQ